MEIRFWIDPETDLPHIFEYGVTEAKMSKAKQKYPAGWEEERVRALAKLYEMQTEVEQVAEHEAAFSGEGQTVMVVPTELVPKIVKFIGKKRSA